MTRAKQEEIQGVAMSQLEWDFLKDVRTTRKNVCEDFVDRQWQKSGHHLKVEERVMCKLASKEKDEESQKKLSQW